MKERLRDISAPELKGVVMLTCQIKNDMPNAPRLSNLSVNIKQQVGVGVSQPTDAQPAAPVVTIEFQLRGARPDHPKDVVVSADAGFLVLFENEGVSHADWVGYTSSPLARNIALQANAACKQIFRGQLRLAGLQSELFKFGKLGEFPQQQPTAKPLPPPPKAKPAHPSGSNTIPRRRRKARAGAGKG